MKKQEWNETARQIWQKLKKFKYPMLVLLLGILLMAIPVRKDTEEKQEAVPSDQLEQSTDDLTATEQKLASILSQMDGAGKVCVMLRYATSDRTIYQTDSSQEVSTEAEGKQTKTEVQTVMASGSGGLEAPLTVQKICPTFQGALVVAEGAGNAEIKLNLVNAVSSLTGLGADKITVIKMKSE